MQAAQAASVPGDLPDLDDLLTTKPNSTQPADEPSGLLDLDELLAESKALARDAKAGEAFREKLKRGGMSGEDKADTERQLREWEARREWQTTGTAVLFNRFACLCCGEAKLVFGGWFQRQVHRTMSHATRLVAADRPQATCRLPKETVFQDNPVPVCDACLPDEWMPA